MELTISGNKKRHRKGQKSYKDRGITKPLTAQQSRFIDLYTNVKSNSFGNAYKSAIQAGFKEEYAKSIIHKNMSWLSEISNRLGDERRLAKAESNLEQVQNIDITNGGDKIDVGILAQRTKVDQFIAQTHDKVKYSTRTENAVLVKVEHTIDEETKKRLDALL